MSEFMSERMKRVKRETSQWSEDYKDERPVRTEPSLMSGHMEGGARTESREAGEKSFGPPVKGGEKRETLESSSKEGSSLIPGPSQTEAPKRGKSKKRKRMKDPLTPKNPLSAYLFFVVKQRSSGSESSKDSFSATAKKIGQKWRAMTHEEKMPFIQLAKYDKQRYLREKYEYLMSKSRTQQEESYHDPYHRMVRMPHNDQKQVPIVAVQERYAPVNIPISYAPAPQPDYRIMPYNPHPPPPQVCLVPAHHASPPPMVFYTHTQQPPPLVRVEAGTYDRSTPTLTTTVTTLAAHTQPILDTQSHYTQPQAVLDTQAQYTQQVLDTQGHYTHTQPVHTQPVHTQPVHTQPVHTQPVQDTQGQQHWQPLQQQQHSSAPPYEEKYHWSTQ